MSPRLKSIVPDRPISADDARWLCAVVEQALVMRDFQRRYYAGDRGLLQACKVAERALDRIMSEAVDPQPSLLDGEGEA